MISSETTLATAELVLGRTMRQEWLDHENVRRQIAFFLSPSFYPFNTHCLEPLNHLSRANASQQHPSCCLFLELIACTHVIVIALLVLPFYKLLSCLGKHSYDTFNFQDYPFLSLIALLITFLPMESTEAREDEHCSCNSSTQGDANEPQENYSEHSSSTCRILFRSSQETFWPTGLPRERPPGISLYWGTSSDSIVWFTLLLYLTDRWLILGCYRSRFWQYFFQ